MIARMIAQQAVHHAEDIAKNQENKQVAKQEPESTVRVVEAEQIQPRNLDEKKPALPAATMMNKIEMAFNWWSRIEPDYATLGALWAASTWFTDGDPDHPKLLFDAHPRLFPIGKKGSGKTQYMKITRAMSRNPTGIVKAPVTAPGLREALHSGRTVFLDEYDRQTGRGMAHLDVQSVVSAYEADTGSLNAVGGVNEQNLFGPMMLAAKDGILTQTNGHLEDLFERSFIVPTVKHADPNDPIPDFDDDFNEITAAFSRGLKMWSAALRPEPGKKLRPIHSVPKDLTARMRQISLPLLAVADRAVDPAVIRAEGEDLRWAIKARSAVKNVLLGHGNDGPSIMEDISERFARLGIG